MKNEDLGDYYIDYLLHNDEDVKEINILCDKEELIKDNKENEDYYKENNINPPKEENNSKEKNKKNINS